MQYEPSEFNNPDYAVSWVTSLIFIFGFLGIACYSRYLIKKHDMDSIQKENPIVDCLLLGLKETPQAKMYWSYFLLRRMAISCVAVFLGSYQSIQIQCLMI